MTDARTDYHLAELRLAQDPGDARHILPPVHPEYRRVLDVGCGAGQTLIACRWPPATIAIGVDPSLAALTLGRSLDRSLKLVVTPGEALPFAASSFDFVYARVALPYMHIGRALAEMARVLRSDGMLWLTLHDWTRAAGDLLGEARRLRMRAVLHGAYCIANGASMHWLGREFAWPFGERRYESFQTARGMSRALTRAGFTDVSIEKGRFFVVTARRA